MAAYGDSYSRFIGWLKIVLPLVALVILSLLFLISRKLDPEAAIPYADVDVNQLIREQRVTAPTFSGVTRDGAALNLSASVVRPDQDAPQRVDADEIDGRLDMPNGSFATFRSGTGIIDAGADRAVMQGGVSFQTSTGYTVGTPGLIARLDRTDIASDGKVTATGPAGTLTAGSMRLTQDQSGNYLLVFNDGVRLVYEPGKPQE